MTETVETMGVRHDSAVETLPERSAAGGGNLLRTVHNLLRGRYPWAISLGVIGLLVGGIVGYRTQQVQYRSTGIVRIRPNLPRILFQSEQNNLMPMFDAFVEGQVALMRSQRVMDLAMENPDWRAVGRGISPEAVLDFRANLQVTRTRSSELVEVNFIDLDPNAAMVAVRAIIESYQKLYGDSDPESSSQRLSVLEERRTTLSNELKSLNDRILTVANEFGSNSLQRIYDAKLDEVTRLDSELRQLQLAIASAETAGPGRGSATQPSGATPPATQPGTQAAATTVPVAPVIKRLPPSVIAQSDPQMRQYLQQRREMERYLLQLGVQYGENHARVLEARRALEALDKDIADYAEEYSIAQATATPSSPGVGIAPGTSIETLRVQEQNIQALYKRSKDELLEIGRKNLQIETLKQDVESVRAKLDETKRRIDQLNVEGSVTGRITVISPGERPLGPYADKRISRAALGGFGGGALGLGLVLLIGLLDRRLRYVADASTGFGQQVRMLGLLPDLPRDLADPGQAALAKHCVHHTRTLLQVHCSGVGRPVYAITSPSPGAGKTSLAAALGLSFAASGARTLLIDCDVIGAGLTRKMNAIARRKLGQILRRENLINEQQFRSALAAAERDHRRLGEVLVEMGYTTGADIERALAVQESSVTGLSDALSGEGLAECVTGTGVPNLYLLPLGAGDDQRLAQLSPSAARRIVEEARASFDVVIIDTGPILGSLDAPVVAAIADEVVMVLSQGEDRDLARKAMDFLLSTGAKMAGIVFNRATERDMLTSGYSSSHRSLMLPAGDGKGGRLGPIAGAVALSTPASDSNGNGHHNG